MLINFLFGPSSLCIYVTVLTPAREVILDWQLGNYIGCCKQYRHLAHDTDSVVDPAV